MDPYIKRAYLPLVRQHVRHGHGWGFEAGTDYWLTLNPGIDQGIADSDTDPGAQLGLPAHGWVATSLVNTAGAGADFASSADRAPNHFLTNADGDLLDSPPIFGDYDHMLMAQRIAQMPDLPRFLIAEFAGAMTVHSAAELDSGWGFIEDGGSPATAGDAIAMIYTDATNFALQINGSLADLGAVDDALWHTFKIVLDRVSDKVVWLIDGVLQNTVDGSGAITDDEFPCSFGFAAGTTNRPGLGWAHVYYDWGSVPTT